MNVRSQGLMKNLMLLGFYILSSHFGDAKLEIKMYQIETGPRSIGSNVTVISELTNLDEYTYLQFVLTAFSNELGEIALGSLLCINPSDPSQDISQYRDNLLFLNLSTNSYSNLTRHIIWQFEYLPQNYSNLNLRTRDSYGDVTANHTLVVLPCQSPENTHPIECSKDQCGFNCVCRFNCSDEFYNENLNTSEEFRCDASAVWSPPAPSCVAEPTTTEIVTTPTAPTTSNGSTQGTNTSPNTITGFTTAGGGKRAINFRQNSGPSFAGIGGGLAAVCICLFVYIANNSIDIPNKITFYAMSVSCLCAWGIALGLCFGMSTNESAVIAGIVLGSLALAGMAVVIGFQILLIKSHKGKGIPGKPEDSSL